MAYLSKRSLIPGEEQRPGSNAGAGLVGSAGVESPGAAQPAPVTGPGSTGNNYANLSQYLAQNQGAGAGLAKSLTDKVNTDLGHAQTLATGPGAPAHQPGGYAGSKIPEAQPVQTSLPKANMANATAQAEAKNLQTDAGRMTALQGIAKGPYTFGSGLLDNYFIGQDPNAQKMIGQTGVKAGQTNQAIGGAVAASNAAPVASTMKPPPHTQYRRPIDLEGDTPVKPVRVPLSDPYSNPHSSGKSQDIEDELDKQRQQRGAFNSLNNYLK